MSFIFILRSCSCFTSTSSGWRWAPEMLACRRPRFCWGAQGLTQSFFLLDEGGGGLITSWESPKFACLPYLGDWVVCLVSPLSSKLKIQEEMQARLWADSALPSVVTVSSSLPVGTLRPQGGCAETCPVFSCFVGQCASDGTRSLATRAGIWERLYFVCVEVEGGVFLPTQFAGSVGRMRASPYGIHLPQMLLMRGWKWVSVSGLPLGCLWTSIPHCSLQGGERETAAGCLGGAPRACLLVGRLHMPPGGRPPPEGPHFLSSTQGLTPGPPTAWPWLEKSSL